MKNILTFGLCVCITQSIYTSDYPSSIAGCHEQINALRMITSLLSNQLCDANQQIIHLQNELDTERTKNNRNITRSAPSSVHTHEVSPRHTTASMK